MDKARFSNLSTCPLIGKWELSKSNGHAFSITAKSNDGKKTETELRPFG